MKRNLIFVLYMTALLVLSASSTAGMQNCSDSDGGKNYYVKGQVEHPLGTNYDYCTDSNTLIERYCLNQSDAYGNIHSYERHFCEKGCREAACINETEPWCITLGTKMNTGNDSRGYIGCDITATGDFIPEKSYCQGQKTGRKAYLMPDAYGRPNQYYATLSGLDPKEEVRVFIVARDGKNIECLPPLNQQAICTDTDGGINYYVKGYVNSTIGGPATDNCPWQSGSGLNKNALAEWYCKNNTRQVIMYNCPYGCREGTCIKKTQCASENEMCGGFAGIICCAWLVCKYDGSPLPLHPDASGICVREPAKCTDSDGGINYYQQGTVTYVDYPGAPPEEKKDYCKSPDEKGIPFAMLNSPLDKICDYPIVAYNNRKVLFNSENEFDPTILETAKSCGTKVVLRLHGFTEGILNDNGVGLDLEKYENRINDFAGLIDPYVEDGTIIAHFTIDEPHDCHDWGFQCPEPSEVDQAGQISKKYWPNLPTSVNTVPGYASRYQWEHTDIINFQYAYHKGPLSQFVEQAIDVLNNGYVDDISWSIMALSGGCPNFGQCPMSPEQVLEVGTAMCNTGEGVFIGFFGYNKNLIDEDMKQAIYQLRLFCSGKGGGGGGGSTLVEYYCDGDKAESVEYECQNGCKEGACIKQLEVKQLEKCDSISCIIRNDFENDMKGIKNIMKKVIKIINSLQYIIE